MLNKIKSFLFENKTDKQTIIKNTFWLLVAEFFSKGSVFVVMLLTAKVLGPDNFGALNFIFSVVVFCGVAIDFGLTTLMVREVSKKPEIKIQILLEGSILKIIIGIITLCVLLGVSQVIDSWGNMIYFIIIYLIYFLTNNIGDFLRASYRPSEKIEREAFLKIMSGLIFFGILLFFIKNDPSILSILLGYLFSGCITLTLILIDLVFFGEKQIGVIKKVNILSLFSYLKQAYPIAIGGVFLTMLENTDKIMLGFIMDHSTVGYYSLAQKIYLIFLFIITYFVFAISPRIVLGKININKAFLVILIGSFFLSFVIFIGSKTIITHLLGSSYLEAIGYLKLFSLLLVVKSINIFYYYYCCNKNKENVFIFIIAILFGINIVLNYYFIIYFGGLGALWGTIASEFLLFFILTFYLKNILFLNSNE